MKNIIKITAIMTSGFSTSICPYTYQLTIYAHWQTCQGSQMSVHLDFNFETKTKCESTGKQALEK
jgi:hypothetical protein